MNPLDLIFGQVANAVQNQSRTDTPGPSYDANPILGALSGLLSNHAQQTGQQFNGYDPNQQYENPAEAHGSNFGGLLGGLGGLFGGGQNQGVSQGGTGGVQSSDADPYGDPEDSGGAQFGGYGNVQSSDADPYGDPEDQR